MTKNTYNVLNVIVRTQKKSHSQISEPCCLRNDRQVVDGPRRWVRCIYLATVLAETLNPSLESSTWILRWPQSRLSAAMHRIRVLSPTAIGRRPGLPVRRERRRQYVRQPSVPAQHRLGPYKESRQDGPHPQGAAAACGAAGLPAVAGGKDCLRSAAPLVGQPRQAPTANSEALPLPLFLNRQEADAVQCRQWEWPLRITILRPSKGASRGEQGARAPLGDCGALWTPPGGTGS